MRSVLGAVLLSLAFAYCCAVPLDSVYRFGGFGGIGVSRYDATFGALPGVPSCCSSYGGSWNLTWGVGLLGERSIGYIQQLPALVQLRIGLHNYSGHLEREEFIGNVIVGDQVYRGVSRYQLDASLWALTLEPLLRVHLPTHQAIGFDFGTRLDWIVRAQYQQQEQLISPSSGAIFETGTTVRNQSSGAIPTHATIGAALQAGISYSLAIDSLWTLRPELRGQFALTPVADVPWRVHRLLAGVTLVRSFAAPAKPPLPPEPPPEPPPQPPLALRVEAHLLGVQRQREDTATVELRARRMLRRTMLMPVVFFAAGSAILDSTARNHLCRIARVAQQRHLVLGIAPSTAPDESDSIKRARFESVRSILESEGAHFSAIPQSPPTPPNTPATAIADELRSVWIVASEPLIEETATTLITSEPSVALVLHAHVSSAVGTVQLQCLLEQDGARQQFELRPNAEESFQLSPAALLNGKSTHYTVAVTARDQRQEPTEQRLQGVIVPVLRVQDTLWQSDRNGLLMLARCNFDAATIADMDSAVAQMVMRALADGRRVTLIGSTDSLGSQSHNRLLARRRAEAALAALKIPASAVTVTESIGQWQSNGTLYGRIASRGVFVRIE